jgi:hypothetical protein
MPGIFSSAAATHPAMVTGGAKGPAADRGQAASLPSAQAAAHKPSPAGEVGPVASRAGSHEFWRIFS